MLKKIEWQLQWAGTCEYIFQVFLLTMLLFLYLIFSLNLNGLKDKTDEMGSMRTYLSSLIKFN